MYRILIVDDETQSRENTQTALISVAENNLFQKERLALAGKHFKIEEFAIAGAAINHVQENKRKNKPDLALLDISFSQLTEDYIKEKKFDPKIEKTTTRGFDVYDAVAGYTQPILFTAYADVHEAIGNELVKRRQLKYVNILSKVQGINLFSIHIANNLETIANQLIANANNRNLTELIPYLAAQNRNQDRILGARIWLDGREFTVRNFFIYKFYLDENGQDLIPEKGIIKYINKFFKPFINTNPIQLQFPFLLGNWKGEWVQQVIIDFRESKYYTNSNNELNIKAANLMLEFFENSHNKPIRQFTSKSERFFTHHNLGGMPQQYGNIPWMETFENGLVLRRAFLGMSILADEHIWSNYKNSTNDKVLDFIMDTIGWENEGAENSRFHFNTLLGLSKAKNVNRNKKDEDGKQIKVHRKQRFNTAIDYILEEEQYFLTIFIPLILEKMLRANNFGDRIPDYTEFIIHPLPTI